MKQFDVPPAYRSQLISQIKQRRRQADRMKKDFSPTRLTIGRMTVLLARHFGFCYGVENAIEISFRAVEEHPDKRIFLLSEMIHNPLVNADLARRGVQFIMDTHGRQLIPWSELKPDDIVMIPAFGTTLEIAEQLHRIGISPIAYNTTCPFVERVWNKASSIGEKGYTVVIHGKPQHEETRASFSHSAAIAPTVIVRDMQQARQLAEFITRKRPADEFFEVFRNQYSSGFNPETDLQRIGVVNQTTMLASETQAIADYLKQVIKTYFQLTDETIDKHFADTRDTLCYATNDNQTAVIRMLEEQADFAIVVGGYNSSNTSHLVELCIEKIPTYFICGPQEIQDNGDIHHWDIHQKQKITTAQVIPAEKDFTVMLTSGASCPDALVEAVIHRLAQVANIPETMWESFLHQSVSA
ncbi:4-hydroxy-3-methylbut-2-enyl diphosphate reductase [Thermoflavifilum aggregans]|uniref:4-hydroxy-3-methylbut-2-enyl diphosphate reductase n=1 Tax=Thermoflavifilum aggregans TaxID=454188 RepID=A0A2M9CWD9_9BACT|nr:4-hydroxy-3-methylbut-2-enyl diphosphate reductase [Thermoflavifilum aggregans]PJJ76221.1 4-hydroxy-3-methylbut-2-enyl diphosphate reductase [Thermoflavifilum aggregans]